MRKETNKQKYHLMSTFQLRAPMLGTLSHHHVGGRDNYQNFIQGGPKAQRD